MSDASCQRAERNPGYKATPIGGEGLCYHSLDFIRTATRVTHGLPPDATLREEIAACCRWHVFPRPVGACSRALAQASVLGAGTGGTQQASEEMRTQQVAQQVAVGSYGLLRRVRCEVEPAIRLCRRIS